MLSSVKHIRTLLADDEPLIRRGIVSLLANERDFDVVGEATSAQEAIERARELMPDMVLLDSHLPGLNGAETTRRIKEILPGVKIVIVTESEDKRDILEARKNGAHGYLLKKIEPRVLADTLRSVMRGKRLFPRIRERTSVG